MTAHRLEPLLQLLHRLQDAQRRVRDEAERLGIQLTLTRVATMQRGTQEIIGTVITKIEIAQIAEALEHQPPGEINAPTSPEREPDLLDCGTGEASLSGQGHAVHDLATGHSGQAPQSRRHRHAVLLAAAGRGRVMRSRPLRLFRAARTIEGRLVHALFSGEWGAAICGVAPSHADKVKSASGLGWRAYYASIKVNCPMCLNPKTNGGIKLPDYLTKEDDNETT